MAPFSLGLPLPLLPCVIPRKTVLQDNAISRFFYRHGEKTVTDPRRARKTFLSRATRKVDFTVCAAIIRKYYFCIIDRAQGVRQLSDKFENNAVVIRSARDIKLRFSRIEMTYQREKKCGSRYDVLFFDRDKFSRGITDFFSFLFSIRVLW